MLHCFETVQQAGGAGAVMSIPVSELKEPEEVAPSPFVKPVDLR